MRILIVEDNEKLSRLVIEHLRAHGFVADAAATGAEFHDCRVTHDYDAYLIDLQLPDQNGLEIVRHLRSQADTIPIVVITARGAIEDRVNGLEAGADDYLVKPFHRDELLARVRAVVRRQPHFVSETMKAGAVDVCMASGTLRCNGQSVQLRASELRLLGLLVRHLGEVVMRSNIENSLVGSDEQKSPNAIDKMVSRLRKSLSKLPTRLELKTVHGRGYRLMEME